MKILLGITGGISLYKSLNVTRLLVKSGHEIRAVMTENAAGMIDPILFKTLSGGEAYVKDFDFREPLAHIRLSDWADVMAIVPATANTIAKIAGGIADNLLTSTALAFNKKMYVFPAMNVKMYENPVTQENLDKLRSRKIEVIEPFCGDLACGYSGMGKLPDEDFIFGYITRDADEPLKGKSFIVTAGGTIEKIDPVRYISNFSSGRMGIEIAKTLFRKGAGVLLIYGNISITLPSYIRSIKIQSAMDLLEALRKNLASYDGLYMAAAPADFRTDSMSESKIKKSAELNLHLVKNPDILKTVSKELKGKLLVGFALETENPVDSAAAKLKEKNLDFIALNIIKDDFNPLGSDFNNITLISRDGTIKEFGEKTKNETAGLLVEETLAGLK